MALLYPTEMPYMLEDEEGNCTVTNDMVPIMYPCKYWSEISSGTQWVWNSITPPTLKHGVHAFTGQVDTNGAPTYTNYYELLTAWPDDYRDWATNNEIRIAECEDSFEWDGRIWGEYYEWNPTIIYKNDPNFNETEGDINQVVWNDWGWNAINVYRDFAVDDMIAGLLIQYVAMKNGSLDYYYEQEWENWDWNDEGTNDGPWVCIGRTGPSDIPNWTQKGFWDYCGLPIVRYRGLVTNDVTYYGWEVGELEQYTVLSNGVVYVSTNDYYCYTEFEAQSYPPIVLGEYVAVKPTIDSRHANGHPNTFTLTGQYRDRDNIPVNACRVSDWVNAEIVFVPSSTTAVTIAGTAHAMWTQGYNVSNETHGFLSGFETVTNDTAVSASSLSTNHPAKYVRDISDCWVQGTGYNTFSFTVDESTAAKLVGQFGTNLAGFGFSLSFRVPPTFDYLGVGPSEHMSWKGLMERVTALNNLDATEHWMPSSNLTSFFSVQRGESAETINLGFGAAEYDDYFTHTETCSEGCSCTSTNITDDDPYEVYANVAEIYAEHRRNDGTVIWETNELPGWSSGGFSAYYRVNTWANSGGYSHDPDCTESFSGSGDYQKWVGSGGSYWWADQYKASTYLYLPYPDSAAEMNYYAYFKLKYVADAITNYTWNLDYDSYILPACTNVNGASSFKAAYSNFQDQYDFSAEDDCTLVGLACDGLEDEGYFFVTNEFIGLTEYSMPSSVSGIRIGVYTEPQGAYSGVNTSGDYFDKQGVETAVRFISAEQPPNELSSGWLSETYSYSASCSTSDTNYPYYSSTCNFSEEYDVLSYRAPLWTLEVDSVIKLIKWDFLYSD